jgi:hypothetical protein
VILVDTNVLLDLATEDPVWAEWSQQQFSLAARQDLIAINDVIYAELSVGYGSTDEIDAMLAAEEIIVLPIPRQALFLDGKAFVRYRKAGGVRTGTLPDFFIGAHADVAGVPLLTRDPRRYGTYFPRVTLIAPSGRNTSKH